MIKKREFAVQKMPESKVGGAGRCRLWRRCPAFLAQVGAVLVQVWKNGWDLRHCSPHKPLLRRRSLPKKHTCTRLVEIIHRIPDRDEFREGEGPSMVKRMSER